VRDCTATHRLEKPLAPPTNFDTTRIRFGEMVAGISGAVLIISLFLEWYNVSAKFANASQGVSGWEALGFIDILLFLIGAIAVAVAVLQAMNVMPRALPASPGLVILVLGGLAVLLTLFRLLSIPDGGVGDLPGIDVGRSFGVFIAFLASIGVAVGGWLTWNLEGKPKPGGVAGGVGGAPAGAPLPGGQPYAGGQPQAPAQPQQQAYTAPASAAAPATAAQPAASAEPAGAAAKADWYPDPRGEKRLRYWDGSQWTDHTAD
jgi:hypothetical protein